MNNDLAYEELVKKGHGLNVRNILWTYCHDHWGHIDKEIRDMGDDEIDKLLDSLDPMQFADTDWKNIRRDGIFVRDYFLAPRQVVWTLSSQNMKRGMSFEDALYTEHIYGNEGRLTRMRPID